MTKTIKYNGNDSYDAKWIEWHYSDKLAAARVIAEIKVRQYQMGPRGDQPEYGSWFIEQDKYNFIMAQPMFEKRLYINAHPDGFQIWNLNQCDEPIWREEELPIDDQTENCKTKWVGDLLTTQSQKVYQKINILETLDKAAQIWKTRQTTN